MRILIDTNVLISALFWGGPPGHVVDLAAAGHFEAVTSAELIAELEDVLAENFAVPQEQIDLVVRDVLSYAQIVGPVEEIRVRVRDRADIKVIAAAVAGSADFIVTGDRDLLSLGEVHGVRVIGVSAFLKEHGR